jgi:hypothetical protein
MLWIISVRSTVLPTPAPPNNPALPPRSSGTSTSIALMPVSKISDFVERSDSGGGFRWIVRHSTFSGGSLRSMADPNTSNIRDMISLPTGTSSGLPESSACIPLARPSVGVSAIARTRAASSWAMTSTMILPSGPACKTEKIGGRRRSNFTSTTPPRTETTDPRFELFTLFCCSNVILSVRLQVGEPESHAKHGRSYIARDRIRHVGLPPEMFHPGTVGANRPSLAIG